MLLQRTQAVRALQDGCSRLSSTATALVQFLTVKRTHDQFVGDQDRDLRMSPGASLDRLWHWMLLNTAVSSKVHELVGGVVEHRGTDDLDLSDDTKLLQRLYGLNIMRLEGLEPDVQLWTEPGTAMHTLHLTAARVPGLQSLPGEGRLFITPTITHQQQQQLTQALQHLYTNSDARDGAPADVTAAARGLKGCAGSCSNGGAPQEQRNNEARPTAAAACRITRSAAAAAAAAALEAADPPAKRSRTTAAPTADQPGQQQQQQQPPVRFYTITVCDQMGQPLRFKVTDSTRVSKLASAIAARWGVELSSFRLVFNARRMFDGSLGQYHLEDGDIIDLYMMQTGC